MQHQRQRNKWARKSSKLVLGAEDVGCERWCRKHELLTKGSIFVIDRLFVGRWRSHEQSLHIRCLRWPSDSVQLIQNRQQALNRDDIKRLPQLWGDKQSWERLHEPGCTFPSVSWTYFTWMHAFRNSDAQSKMQLISTRFLCRSWNTRSLFKDDPWRQGETQLLRRGPDVETRISTSHGYISRICG